MPNNQMAFSLLFKVIDSASAKIREIVNVMGEPVDAATKIGDASDKAADRQVSAFRRAGDALHAMSEAMTRPMQRLAELGKAAGEASEKFAHSFAGIGAIVAEGFSVKAVAQQEEFFRRLQINAGLSKDAIEKLREAIGQASDHYAVSKDQMVQVFTSYRANGGDVDAFRKNADTIAAAMQVTGMDAEHAGQMFATMQNKMHIEPGQTLSVLAQMRAQLLGIPGGMDAAAEASARLAAAMEALHMNGAQGMLALNAVYAVASRSTGNARLARGMTDTWISQLADRGYQNQLSQGLGERITDKNGLIQDPRLIMQKMAQRYAWAQSLPKDQQVVAEQRLDALFGDAASKMFRSVGGEIKATGHSETIDKVLGAQGDGADFLRKAKDDSDGLTGSMNRLRTAMDNASESLLTGPINMFAAALNHCNGIVADAVIGFAGFILLGQGIKWVEGAWQGIKLLGAVLSVFGTEAAAAAAGTEALAAAEGVATVATASWSAALLANPITWIVLAIVAAVAALSIGAYELYQHWDTVWKYTKGFFGWFSDAVDSMFKNPFLGAITAVMSPALALFELPKLFGSSWTEWFTKMGAEFDTLITKVSDFIDKAGQAAGMSQDSVSGAEQGAAWGSAFGIPGMIIGGMIGGYVGSGAKPGPHGGETGSGSGASGAHGGTSGHNLGNLRNIHGAGFQRFASDNDGALAMAHQLQLYQHRDHLNTISQIVRKYAPPNENNTAAYIAYVAGQMHINPNAALNLDDRGQLSSLMHAMIHKEQGHDVLSMAQLDDVLGKGGIPQRVAGSGTAVAGNDNKHSIWGAGGGFAHTITGSSSIYGGGTASSGPHAVPEVPPLIYGGGAGSIGSSSALADAGSSDDGDTKARAEVTIRILDDKHRTKAHVEHTSNMEAHLDRGAPMQLSWG
jgi:hypothetical protein